MELIGYISAIAIGISLGIIGGGGSILTVPVLVYLFHIEPLLATSYSLFIVGVTSAVGSIPYFKNNLIDFQSVLYFGIPSIISVLLTRLFIIEVIPMSLFYIGSFEVTKNIGIMILFAVLMIFAAYKMIHDKSIDAIPRNKPKKLIPMLFLGAIVGFISGLVGAGGGFLIIPALIIFNQMSMKKAVGTSLVIISINSLFGFIGKLDFQLINWTFLLTLSIIAIIGILIGSKMSQKIDGKKLKPTFGWFVLVMGLVVILKEITK